MCGGRLVVRFVEMGGVREGEEERWWIDAFSACMHMWIVVREEESGQKSYTRLVLETQDIHLFAQFSRLVSLGTVD